MRKEEFSRHPKTYWTLSPNNHHLGALIEALAVQLTALHARPHNRRTARPVSRARVLFQELDVLEAVRVDNEGAEARRSTPFRVVSIAYFPAKLCFALAYMKSCPVFRIIKRRLRSRAKSTPALICDFVVARMT